jgi:uncharacterized protein YjbJ (UPF0337 family)
MMRLVAPVLLVALFGMALPLAVGHAQSTAATDQRAERSWAKYKGWTQPFEEAREKWGKLTDADIREIDGRREILIAKLQARYAISHDEAERQVGDFDAGVPSRRP